MHRPPGADWSWLLTYLSGALAGFALGLDPMRWTSYIGIGFVVLLHCVLATLDRIYWERR